MKADVQYNDFKGTTASDSSDHKTLKDFLQERGVDTDRYNPIGSSFYSTYTSFDARIICIDTEKSTQEEPYIVEVDFETNINKEQYFNLFKRFKAITVEDHYNKYEIKDLITIDDRQQNEDD